MKRYLLLIVTGLFVLSACSHSHYTSRGLVKPKKSKKCGTCPTW